jgi:hypothetical protein
VILTSALALVAMVSATPPASAVDLYVGPAGAGAVCSAAAPCATIGTAIGVSLPGDVIHVAAGNYAEFGLVIPHSLSIVGDGPATTTVDGGGLGTLFTINGAATGVVIRRLTLTNGDALGGAGGAILHLAGDLTVAGSRLVGNQAGTGGAIAQMSYGRLLVLSSELEDNSSTATGGAISCDEVCGGVDVVLSLIRDNTAGSTGGAIHIEVADLGVWLSGISDNDADYGGAIRALGSPVTILDSALQRNHADVDGGGVSTTGDLVIQRSTFAENDAADNGGAVHAAGSQTVAVSNSTFSGNSAFCGGAFSLIDGFAVGPTALMGASTFYGNHGSFAGCADHFQTGVATSLEVYNSILEGGLGVAACNAPMAGGAHNLIDDPSCNTGAASFNQGQVTFLDPVLAYNGGPTRTHLIDPASNAVDAGRNAACLNPVAATPLVMDQRGQTRPIDFTLTGTPTCDIGAVELQ